jgi:hypothetical protein
MIITGIKTGAEFGLYARTVMDAINKLPDSDLVTIKVTGTKRTRDVRDALTDIANMMGM